MAPSGTVSTGSGPFRSPRGVNDVADGRRRTPDGGSRGRSQGSRPDARRGQRGGQRGAQGDKAAPRGRRPDWSRSGDRQVPRTEEQVRYDGPPIPEEITGQELDRSVSTQLKGLPDRLALRVARHLAAAGVLIDSDPETAYQHTLAARARVPRLAVVREATGEAAYAAGHYAEALADLRAATRMNGATDYLPIMADCQRALAHPERALKLAKGPAAANSSPPARGEMPRVGAGARRDMGQLDAALRT